MYYNKVEICGVNTSKLKTLTDAEKEEQIAAIKSESEYVRIEAEMAALDLRLAALGSNWDDLDTDIEA